uniref:Asteroid domain-containing protein n=1 Tax=Anopheles stephensi TaxID=30069 RepID=A0A182YM89_ANOST
MGVRHLQTFMDKKVSHGTYSVRMEREIQNAKQAAGTSPPPLVVIDLMAMFSLFCSDVRGLLCGSQVRRIERTAGDFFKRLTDAGAELVFFYDGKLQANKYETWTTRQNEKYYRMLDIIDAIDARVPLERVAAQFEHNIPSNTCLKLRRVAKRHGKVVIETEMECDQALAIFATKHGALAIITHDTDFLIFEGNWQLWHANRINLTTLVAQAYNRQALLRTLGLQWQQMAVWATLAGTDFFKYDELEPFLNGLGPHHRKFYKLADYVRSLPITKDLQASTVNGILGRVYKNRRMPTEAFEWFRQSVAFYQIDAPTAGGTPAANDRFGFLLQAEQCFAHTVLTGAPFNCTLFFFDYRTTEFTNYYEIIEPLIARIGGILLYHYQPERNHMTVVVKRNHEEPHTFVTVPVTYPQAVTPPEVKDLISKDANLLSSLLPRKLQLLRWVCSEELLTREEQSNDIPPALLLTVLTLYRLRRTGAIRMFEADLLLLIAYQDTHELFDPAEEPYPQRLIARAFRLAFLFQKVYTHLARIAKALGLPQSYRPSTPFDGLRFHNLYRVWNCTRVETHHLEPIKEWRLYEFASY